MQHPWFPLFLFSSDFTRHRGLLGCNTGHCLRSTSCSLGSSSSIVCPVPWHRIYPSPSQTFISNTTGAFSLCWCFASASSKRCGREGGLLAKMSEELILRNCSVVHHPERPCFPLHWGFVGLCSGALRGFVHAYSFGGLRQKGYPTIYFFTPHESQNVPQGSREFDTNS